MPTFLLVIKLEMGQKFGFELLILLCPNIFLIIPNFVSRYVATRLDTLIIGFLLKLTSLENILNTNKYWVSLLISRLGSWARLGARISFMFAKKMKIIFAIQLETRVIKTWIFCIFVCKFWLKRSFFQLFCFQ